MPRSIMEHENSVSKELPQVEVALPKILRLPSALADQIAAGEVVERPASVVKELVENSLDAGARTIRVEIEEGGLKRIAILDDGHGMTREGALLALERHATSKILQFDDLFHLATFGFRGEALPSIAAVSRFRLTTRPKQALSATEITVIAGETPSVREVGAPAGTSIEVNDLFYNVPARRKFIKSTATEGAHVSEVCLELALARPDLTLTLVRDGRVVRQYLRAENRLARAQDVIHKSNEGRESHESFVHTKAQRPRIEIEVYVSQPEKSRSGATSLHLLVNGRSVRDRSLARAVAMAYGSLLEPGRYPIGIVYIDVPSEDVDVNVHPQKAEVRFARGREFYDEVTRALGVALAEALRGIKERSSLPSMLRNLPKSTPDPLAPLPTEWSTLMPVKEATHELSQAMNEAIQPMPRERPSSNLMSMEQADIKSDFGSAIDPWGLAPSSKLNEATQPNLLAFSSTQNETNAMKEPTLNGYPSLRFLAQVKAMYLICESDQGLYVIDQHAAAERINFDKLKKDFLSRHIVQQQLLISEIVHVTEDEAALVDEIRDSIASLGIDAQTIGGNRVAVHGIPRLLSKASPQVLLRDLLDELARTGERSFGDKVDLVLATMACHGSVRAGDVLHANECEALLKALDTIDFSGYCPHGRPILFSISFGELEKKVGRR